MSASTQNVSRQGVTVVNRKGLHARAAAKVSKLAAKFEASITLHHDGETASAASIMDMLMLVAHTGCELIIEANGPDAASAVTAISSLVADGFGEHAADDEFY